MFKFNFNKFNNEILKGQYSQYLIISVFFLFLITGFTIVKDYGISTDEPFQRSIGYFYYISLIEKFFFNQELLIALKNKFQNMYWANEIINGEYIQYGVLFDLFATSLEEFFKIEGDRNAFHLKHTVTFLTFFISSIFFYKIILDRFKNKILAITATIFFITTPRIFAESFYNCKDIVFMCFCIYSLYFCFKSFNEFTLKNIFLFSLFSAFATNIRIMGILLFVLFIIFFILNTLEQENYFKKNFKNFLFFSLSYPILVFLFWPYLWDSPLQNFIAAFNSFANYDWGGQVLYLGKYVKANNLPWHYIPIWILITLPLPFLFLSLTGFLKILFLFTNKILNLSEKNKLWTQINDKKDFFILSFFLLPIFLVILLDSTLYAGWRHLYFIYPCLIYFIAIGIKYILDLQLKIFSEKISSSIIFFVLCFNIYNLIKLHPYQNIYFNSLVENRANKLFEIDYWGLGNYEAINFLLENEKKNNVSIRTASFTPLFYSKLMLNDKNKKISLTGTEQYDQDFIFTNYIYENNPRYLKKYIIPKNYTKFFTLKRGNVIINEIYRKN